LLLTSLSLAMALAAPHGAGMSPQEAVRAFLTAVASADTTSALDLLAPEACEHVENMIEERPALLCSLAAGFGVQLRPDQVAEMGGREFLRAMVASPALGGMLIFARYDLGTPELEDDRALVPVAYRFMGMSDTLVIELLRGRGGWELSDYYGRMPAPGRD